MLWLSGRKAQGVCPGRGMTCLFGARSELGVRTGMDMIFKSADSYGKPRSNLEPLP